MYPAWALPALKRTLLYQPNTSATLLCTESVLAPAGWYQLLATTSHFSPLDRGGQGRAGQRAGGNFQQQVGGSIKDLDHLTGFEESFVRVTYFNLTHIHLGKCNCGSSILKWYKVHHHGLQKNLRQYKCGNYEVKHHLIKVEVRNRKCQRGNMWLHRGDKSEQKRCALLCIGVRCALYWRVQLSAKIAQISQKGVLWLILMRASVIYGARQA